MGRSPLSTTCSVGLNKVVGGRPVRAMTVSGSQVGIGALTSEHALLSSRRGFLEPDRLHSDGRRPIVIGPPTHRMEVPAQGLESVALTFNFRRGPHATLA